VTVVYGGATSADDVIIQRLPVGKQARNWVIVTDDRGLGARARERGATVRGLAEWSRKPKSTPKRPRTESKLSSHEIADWQAFFQGDPD
jgi:hypothetical protein